MSSETDTHKCRRPFFDARLEQLYLLSPYWYRAGWGSALSVELLACVYAFLTRLYEDKDDFPKPVIYVNTLADIILSWGDYELSFSKGVVRYDHIRSDFVTAYKWPELLGGELQSTEDRKQKDDQDEVASLKDNIPVLTETTQPSDHPKELDWRTRLPDWASFDNLHAFFMHSLSRSSNGPQVQQPWSRTENFQIHQLDGVFHAWSQQANISTARDWPQQVKTTGSPVLTSSPLSVTTAKQDWCCPNEIIFPFVYQSNTYKSRLQNVFRVSEVCQSEATVTTAQHKSAQRPLLTYEMVLPQPHLASSTLTRKQGVPSHWVQLERKEIEEFVVFPKILSFVKNFLQSDVRVMVLYDFHQEHCQLRFTCKNIQAPLLTISFEWMPIENPCFQWE